MLKISVITGTRAYYGLFYRLLNDLEDHTKLKLNIITTGLSNNFRSDKQIYNNPYVEGMTSKRIIKWIEELDLKNRKFFYDLSLSELD